ncbi:hypothetical protein QJS63_21200 [Pseudomonas juntendi]|nr:hypothetical protein QJS63_21200 [Pseudomonas juntendi]
MSEPIASQEGWVHAMKDAWGSVPASDLLNPDSNYWGVIHLGAPDRAECASFAMAGRALKYGRSMAIALPVLGGEALTRLMVYLHRIRMDALQGGIRSPWLNPENMEQSPDVVFISRPRAGFHDISRVAELRARVLRSSDLKRTKASTSQTLVVDGSSGVMDLTEVIGKGSKPFVFVIDGTRGGNDNAAAVDSALEESFPQIPESPCCPWGTVSPWKNACEWLAQPLVAHEVRRQAFALPYCRTWMPFCVDGDSGR